MFKSETQRNGAWAVSGFVLGFAIALLSTWVGQPPTPVTYSDIVKFLNQLPDTGGYSTE